MSKPEVMLWISDTRGQYIPRDFAKSFADRSKSVTGVSDEDWAILEAGPEHEPEVGVLNESYWDVWDDVCRDAVVTDEHGNKYTIWQDGDCWLVPVGMELNEREGFVWPRSDEGDEESAHD